MSVTRPVYVLADRYRLEGRIAAGGMGEVWQATDRALGRPVAVKLLRAEYVQHPEILARFRAEARHAGSLSHPHIARIYDYGEADATHPPFLVMELVNGPPLTRLLASGPMEPARVMDLVTQAADGLAAAHAAGLVHRDIKPGNLLLAPPDQLKITDFGIAYAAGSAPITRTGMLIGTPAYLAPERVAGAGATPASDLYSLGIVAYECLAGTLPFSGTAMEVALSHQMRTLPPLPATVPAEAVALVGELTAKDPAARPASAREVMTRAGRLRDALAGAPAAGAAPQHPGTTPSHPGAAPASAGPGFWPAPLAADAGTRPASPPARPGERSASPAGPSFWPAPPVAGSGARPVSPAAGADAWPTAAADAGARPASPPSGAGAWPASLPTGAEGWPASPPTRADAWPTAPAADAGAWPASPPTGADAWLTAAAADAGAWSASPPAGAGAWPASPPAGAGAWPTSPPATASDAQTDTLIASDATLREIGATGPPPGQHRLGPRGRGRRGRLIVLAVAAAAVVALGGWALAGLSGGTSASGGPAATSPPNRTPQTQPATRMVQVNAGALVGQPVRVVTQRLRRRGLRVQVEFTRTDGGPPGMVLSVQPNGPVAVGSTVIVTAARPQHGHGHDHGQGGGDGGGGGNGQGGD